MSTPEGAIVAAAVVVPCAELDPALAFFVDRLGFRVDAISPADHPTRATISAHGVRLELSEGVEGDPGTLRLRCSDPRTLGGGTHQLLAPNGTRIELVEADPPVVLPPLEPALVVTRRSDADRWGAGRAGMHYRDLIPSRLGGRFIASHIAIPGGGPVPDYVHFHHIRFQLIYCAAGWVRVVYEDQGPPFVLEAGDCVLQPPGIRHRVLEASPGLEVVEITSPARHDTFADHELALPTAEVRPERDFAGQRFVRHQAATARWDRRNRDGFECRDTGIAAATDGLAGVVVTRPAAASTRGPWEHDAELLWRYVLAGGASLSVGDRSPERLAKGDAVVVPAGVPHRLESWSSDFELLEVALPAAYSVTEGAALSPSTSPSPGP